MTHVWVFVKLKIKKVLGNKKLPPRITREAAENSGGEAGICTLMSLLILSLQRRKLPVLPTLRHSPHFKTGLSPARVILFSFVKEFSFEKL